MPYYHAPGRSSFYNSYSLASYTVFMGTRPDAGLRLTQRALFHRPCLSSILSLSLSLSLAVSADLPSLHNAAMPACSGDPPGPLIKPIPSVSVTTSAMPSVIADVTTLPTVRAFLLKTIPCPPSPVAQRNPLGHYTRHSLVYTAYLLCGAPALADL